MIFFLNVRILSYSTLRLFLIAASSAYAAMLLQNFDLSRIADFSMICVNIVVSDTKLSFKFPCIKYVLHFFFGDVIFSNFSVLCISFLIILSGAPGIPFRVSLEEKVSFMSTHLRLLILSAYAH